MAKTHAFVKTEKGRQYLQQLCKHWSHKGSTEFSPEAGWVAFDSGNRVDLMAEASGLNVHVTSPDETELEMFRHVVVEHLARFGFREQLVFDWSAETENDHAKD